MTHSEAGRLGGLKSGQGKSKRKSSTDKQYKSFKKKQTKKNAVLHKRDPEKGFFD